MKIPYEQLDKTVLRAIIEDYVTREGTDYGQTDYSLDEKVAQVIGQLERGDAEINFDGDSESVSIVSVK